LARPVTVASWIRIVPTRDALVVRIRTTPDQTRKPASVTTKDGTPAFVTMTPCSSPIPVVQISPAAMASHQGQPGSSGRRSKVMMTPPTALTKATERSISAISRTKTTPIAMIAIGAVCRMRFVKLREVRNTSFFTPNVTKMITSATMIGSEPSSPARTPWSQSRT
jgi:hypothetical protein